MKKQPQHNKQPQEKLPWVPPILKLGTLLAKTGQGGTSNEYDAWDTKRK